MARLLKGIGTVLIISGIVIGVPAGLHMNSFWLAASMILGGLLSGIIFVALGVILEQIEENREYLAYIAELLPKPERPPGPLKPPAKQDTRSALEKLKDYKLELSDSQES